MNEFIFILIISKIIITLLDIITKKLQYFLNKYLKNIKIVQLFIRFFIKSSFLYKKMSRFISLIKSFLLYDLLSAIIIFE